PRSARVLRTTKWGHPRMVARRWFGEAATNKKKVDGAATRSHPPEEDTRDKGTLARARNGSRRYLGCESDGCDPVRERSRSPRCGADRSVRAAPTDPWLGGFRDRLGHRSRLGWPRADRVRAHPGQPPATSEYPRPTAKAARHRRLPLQRSG